MALTPGTRLGPYAITAQIGKGGMGEVYRATDTKLKRDVAVKVLPAALASDPERLARFQREAEVLASLNHPNIAIVYGLEQARDVHALVMELVEGDDLSQRIARGAIPVDEALPIAKQIAEALEAAHEQGIIHRDLKPANIKVRPDGTVKVLDFGLAKALEPAGASANISQSPTLTTPAMTERGVILGTAAYMSPEQARGKTVDKCSDVWAFGAVLYEMLTGKRAFAGSDISDVLASVLAREPDWTLLPPTLSPTLAIYIKRCLHKDPKQRVPDIAAMRLALEGAFETGGSQPAESVPEPAVWRRPVPVAVAASLLTAVVAGFVGWSLRPSAEPRSITRFHYDLPDGQEFRVQARAVMAFSPDGRHFVYNTPQGLYLRSMGALEARLIPGTEEPLGTPFFSPDGESVGYFSLSGDLQRVPITGGAPVVVASGLPPPGVRGASWGTDDSILFSHPDGIMRVSANGGTPELVIAAEAGEQLDSPQWLPDGESVLFSVTTVRGGTRWNQAQVVVQSLITGERTVLLQGGSDARYLPTGHLVYAQETGLFAVAFDLDRLEVQGSPVSMVEGLRRAGGVNSAASANYAVSDLGTMIWLSSNVGGFGQIGAFIATSRTLAWVDRQGREELLAAPPRSYSYPRLSPDGTQVAVDVRDAESDIWVWNIARETLTRLTFDPAQDRFPLWSPNGRRIAFSSQRDGSGGNPFWRAADGTGTVEQLAEQSDQQVFPTSFVPDGTQLLVYGDVSGTQQDDVGMVTVGGDGGVAPLLGTSFGERNAEVSPDGRWLAYESDESGQLEVYVRPFPDIDAGRWQVSTGGGTQPLWARNGRELFYRSGDALMSVTFEATEGFVARSPVELFSGQYAPSLGGRNYDVTPDGQRFLMLKEGGAADTGTPIRRFIIVENWFEELRQRVPTN